jgi:hypothetical protein
VRTIRDSGPSYEIQHFSGPRFLSYALIIDGKRRITGDICKEIPGWKRVWDDIREGLVQLAKEFEGGAGLQSRAFQQTPQSSRVYSTELT